MENVVKNQTNTKLMCSENSLTLSGISNDIEDESCYINGISNILLCISDNTSELNCDAVLVLAEMLSDTHQKLSEMSKSIMEVSKSI